jgi:nucleoside transporter
MQPLRTQEEAMPDGVRWRLSVMMFLEYVIWGSWLPLLSHYLTRALHFSGTDIGWVFATQAIASITAVGISGQIADRHLSTERFLALSHLIGGVALIALRFQTSFWPFFIVMLVYTLAYVPTLSLTNSISFHHLKDAQDDFGRVRLWGTIGWIAASWPFVFILAGKTGTALDSALASIFVVAGIASLLLAGFSLFLPPTPPAREATTKSAPLQAIKLLAIPIVLVLFVVTLMDSLVHQCYFLYTGDFLASIGVAENWIMPAMSIGQVAEIATMAVLGMLLKRLGWRMTLSLGILGHVVRFCIFALGTPLWLVIGSNLVHGFCYACFFASVYIFVDQQFPKHVRASAQGLFNFLIVGVGQFVGSLLGGALRDRLTTAQGVDFHRLFLYPAGLGLAALVVLLVGFHPKAATPAAS